MYTAQETAERIKNKAKSKNILIKTLLDECGLSKNALSSMLSRGSWLQANNIAKIADYLDCSVDYLLGRTDVPEVNRGVLGASTSSANLSDSIQKALDDECAAIDADLAEEDA